MILEAIGLGIMVGSWAYHRWWDDKPEVKDPERRFQIPRVDNGAPIGLIYGRTRVRNPLLAFVVADYSTFVAGSDCYQIKALFSLGLPFANPATNVVHGTWSGDIRGSWQLNVGGPGTTQTGDGEYEDLIVSGYGKLNGIITGGVAETLNGKATQVIVDSGGTSHTYTGDELLNHVPAAGIPGYRGVMSVFLSRGPNAGFGWVIGSDATIPSFSFEASSYKNYAFLLSTAHYKIGDDANPVCVLYDLLTGTLGKAGIPTTYIDETSFAYAAQTLASEQHGFSGVLEGSRTLAEHVIDVLKQIDAVIYEGPSDGKIYLTLIRDSNGSPREITKDNCEAIENFTIGGQQGLVNQVRIVYQSRVREYQDADVAARNGANAVGQGGYTNESALEFRGISNATTARAVAVRELAARCRPIIKCRAILDRTWYDLVPGEIVKLTWSKPDVGGLLFRVARVDRGSLSDGRIAADLLLDTTYMKRGVPTSIHDTRVVFVEESPKVRP